jgi:SET domain
MISPTKFVMLATSCAFVSPILINGWMPPRLVLRSSLKARASRYCGSGSYVCAHKTIQEEVRSARLVRHTGVALGGGILSLAGTVGIAVGMFDPVAILLPTVATLVLFLVNSWRHNEYRSPLPESAFEIKASLIPNAGQGLFAANTIPKDMYLMDYAGELLSEEEYFIRYPSGQGRYVASVNEPIPLPGLGILSQPTYIDAIHPPSSLDQSTNRLARYMNSLTIQDGANVYWRKQRYGPQGGRMHLYALRDISMGEELCFDYGENYWGALVE